MLRLTCFALLMSFVLSLELQAKIGSQWQKFKSVHGKKYSGAEEERRKGIFKKNVQSILEHNLRYDLGEVTYTKGVNHFTDMDEDEFKNMLGLIYTPVNATKKIVKKSKSFTAPETWDWRYSETPVVTPVRNQDAPIMGCGSCWTFSAAAVVEGAWALKHKELVEVSTQNLLDCTTELNNKCKGGFVHTALKYIIKNGGVNAEECYPYRAENSSVCYYNRNCKTVKIDRSHLFTGEDDLMQIVVEFGPVGVGIFATEEFRDYKYGIYDSLNCNQNNVNHAVTLIGYGTAADGTDYWLIKNSWGADWGEEGFIRIVRNKRMCGLGLYNVVAVA